MGAGAFGLKKTGMIIIQLKGGLGNQLFQYAAAAQLAANLNTSVALDISAYEADNEIRSYMLQYFNITERFASKKEVAFYKKGNYIVNHFFKSLKPFNYKEKGLRYNTDLFTIKQNKVLLNGYFQSELYFKEIRDSIVKMFQVKVPAEGLNNEAINNIKNTNSVSLHIRRGDYVSNPTVNAVHTVCDMAYYAQALTYLKGSLNQAHIFIFSDDIPWAKQNLDTLGMPCTFIDFNTPDNCYEDLRLMYSCKHNIIANSSFSWWGAWLNTNNDKTVIAPKKWFNINNEASETIVPQSWIRL